MTTFEILSLLSSVAIGAGQIGIVWYGIRSMNRSSEERARDRVQREAGERQRAVWERQRAAQEDQRHAEAMQAQDKRHEEAVQAQDKRHEEAVQALAMQRLALETLIERTAPPRADRRHRLNAGFQCKLRDRDTPPSGERPKKAGHIGEALLCCEQADGGEALGFSMCAGTGEKRFPVPASGRARASRPTGETSVPYRVRPSRASSPGRCS